MYAVGPRRRGIMEDEVGLYRAGIFDAVAVCSDVSLLDLILKLLLNG